MEINQRLSILDNLKIQIDALNKKKQEIEKLYLDAVSNLNYVISQTSYSIEDTRQINEEINKRILTPLH